MSRAAAVVLLALACCGCMVSTQDGERTHVNAQYPDHMAFHFESGFNEFVLFGRTALLIGVASLLWRRGSSRGDTIVGLTLAAVILAGAAVLHVRGVTKMRDYRIEVQPEQLVVQLPGQPEQAIPWLEIEGLSVDGTTSSIRIADGSGQGLTGITRWESMWIRQLDGSESTVDLAPLSSEQRGTLWRAVVRRAQLEEMDGREKITIVPAPPREGT